MAVLHRFYCIIDGEHNEEGNGTRIAPNDDVSGYSQYEEVCKSLAIVPIRKISEQLKEDEMRLQHIGMNNIDSKALACALWVRGLSEVFQCSKICIFYFSFNHKVFRIAKRV